MTHSPDYLGSPDVARSRSFRGGLVVVLIFSDGWGLIEARPVRDEHVTPAELAAAEGHLAALRADGLLDKPVVLMNGVLGIPADHLSAQTPREIAADMATTATWSEALAWLEAEGFVLAEDEPYSHEDGADAWRVMPAGWLSPL